MKELLIGNLKVNFIDESSLPAKEIVSAVFFIGFIENKVIAIRNERGWDIPGGHVEASDANLIEAIKREVEEEAAAVFQCIKPFATLTYSGKKHTMLFFTSKNCLLNNFISKKDVFERKLMTIPEFITKYNWKKQVIVPLIERALKQ